MNALPAHLFRMVTMIGEAAANDLHIGRDSGSREACPPPAFRRAPLGDEAAAVYASNIPAMAPADSTR
jgi:hypothetical protein